MSQNVVSHVCWLHVFVADRSKAASSVISSFQVPKLVVRSIQDCMR